MVVATSVVNMYAKSQQIDYTRRVFEYSLKKDLIPWNALLVAYVEHALSSKALELFHQMQHQSFQPNVLWYLGTPCFLHSEGIIWSMRQKIYSHKCVPLVLNLM